MSELNHVGNGCNGLHRQLLSTASAIAVLAGLYGVSTANAADNDADRPTVWIELGGQLERVDGSQRTFAPSFLLTTPRPAVETFSPLRAQRPARYDNGAEGKIIFQPQNSDWIFSAAVRYGRSNAQRHLHNEIDLPTTANFYFGTIPLEHAVGLKLAPNEADATFRYNESHAILDFQVGRDVGLGMLGGHGRSSVALGIRFTQLDSASTTSLNETPDSALQTNLEFPQEHYHYVAVETAERSFRGVGPSIAWDASAPFAGTEQNGEISVDWGMNAAVLFGRQKVRAHHKTTSTYVAIKYFGSPKYTTNNTYNSANPVRARSIVVPNMGGFAGLSFRYADAKISLGYRGDFFFGAMDGGIDTAKKENRGFYGPFASISVGIGG